MSPAGDAIEVRYSSTRRELWRWYITMWRRKLWFFHLVIGLTFFFGSIVGQVWIAAARQPGLVELPLGNWLVSGAITIGVLLSFAAYPQLRFKPQQRWLRVGPDGIQTKIGAVSGSRIWSEVADVEPFDDGVRIGMRNLNSFLVPLRAFTSTADRDRFLVAARDWRDKAQG